MAKSKKAGADNAPAPVAGIEMLAIHELVNSPTNPRKTYSVPELEELARSIRDHGLINPIADQHQRAGRSVEQIGKLYLSENQTHKPFR